VAPQHEGRLHRHLGSAQEGFHRQLHGHLLAARQQV
jgi:hypothetical protein